MLKQLTLTTAVLAGFAMTTANAALVAYYPVDSETDSSTFLDDVIDDATHKMTDASTSSTAGAIINDPTRGDVLYTVQGHRMTGGTQDIDMLKGFTWSFWVKYDPAASGNADSGADTLVGTRNEWKPASGNTTPGYNQWNKLQPSGTGNWTNSISYTIPGDMAWHHVVFTGFSDGTNTDVSLYIDGSFVDNDTSVALYYDGRWEIGGTSRYSEDAEAYLDDIAIWDERISEETIIALANGADPQTIPEPASLTVGLVGMALIFARRKR